MKQAPEKFRLFGTVGGGYNELLDTCDQNNYSFTTGRRFNGGKTGVIVSASGSETNRGNQDMEVVYTPTLDAQRAESRAGTRCIAGAWDSPARSTSSRAPIRSFTVRARLQPLHRRPREPAARALGRRQPPHRSRAARPHAHRADHVARPQRSAHRRRLDDGRLPAARRLLRSARPADDDDDVPAHQRQLSRRT